MQCKNPFLFLLLLISPTAQAEDLCETRASVHQRANYCHENWEFLPPATNCAQEFFDLISVEQPRLQKLLNSQLKSAKQDAQNLNFKTNDQVLKTSIEETSYLIDFGKQVHTELEDYVYSLVLPIYDDADRGVDLSDPSIKARFMDRECYGDPVTELESMQKRMRPWIEQLEKMKAQLLAMSGKTEQRDANLKASGSLVNTAVGQPNGTPKLGKVPGGSSKKKESTITGKIKNEKLPQ